MKQLRWSMLTVVVLMAFAVGMTGAVRAQPQYSTSFLTTVSPSSIPFNSTTNNKVQWVFHPSDFSSAPSGNITRIYFRRQPSMLPVINTYTNLTIKMGETSLGSLPPGPWVTGGMSTVFQASTFDFIPTPGNWMPVTLQTPFNYTGSSNFIVEVSHGGFGVGFDVMQAPLTGRSVYGSTTSPMSNPQNVLVDFGFDMGAGGTDAGLEGLTGVADTLCEGSHSLSATLLNNGPATLQNVTIQWKVNGVVQSPVNWNGTLPANNTVSVSLGSYTFVAGNPYSVIAWTYNPNNQADPDPSNDTATVYVSQVYQQPTATPASHQLGICHGDSAELTGSLSGIPPWSFSVSDGTTVYNLQNLLSPSYALWVAPTSTTTYTFQALTDGSGCQGTLPSSIQVVVRPNPTVDAGPDQTIRMTDSVELVAASTGVTYLWSTGATTPSIWVKGSDFSAGTHTFSVTVTDNHQCTGSDSVSVTIVDDTGVEARENLLQFSASPNPSVGEVTLHIQGTRSEMVHIEVLSLEGKVRHNQLAEILAGEQTIQLDLHHLPDGLYLIRLRGEQFSTVKKMVIRK